MAAERSLTLFPISEIFVSQSHRGTCIFLEQILTETFVEFQMNDCKISFKAMTEIFVQSGSTCQRVQ